MDEQLKQRLLDYLDAIEAGASQLGTAAHEQAPEVARELVNWTLAQGVMAIAFGLGLAVIVAFLSKWMIKIDDDELRVGGYVIRVIGSALSLLPITIGVPQIVNALVAPRLIILEEVTRILSRLT